MPRIIVQSDSPDPYVTHQERVRSFEFDSEHFSRQLIERVSWAVSDAEDEEHERSSASSSRSFAGAGHA
jgi:hypothetical protein